MKIDKILESMTPSSSTSNTGGGQSPTFGRSNKFLEDELKETTSSGAIASVATPIGKMQKRGAGSMLKGIKTSKKFVNSPMSEADISENDLIIVPGQMSKRNRGFMPRGTSRIDHEVEMARSDLIQCAKNAKQIHGLIKNLSEEDGLDGWVQEKITKAEDYLNTVRSYLEGKQQAGLEAANPKQAAIAIAKKKEQGVAEETGDEKFDSMLGRIATEPKVPDMHPDMPPTSIPELLQWAKENNKPYHYKFAEWAKKHNFTNVNAALEWFGDNVDPWDEFGPKDHLNVFGDIVGEPLIDAAKHNPKAAELLKVFASYEKIYDDWTDEYRQMNSPNRLSEGAVKTLSMDLKSMSDKEFIAKYKKTKAEMRSSMKDVTESNGHHQAVNDYDTWSDQVASQGAEIHPQRDRVRLVAQSWDGDTIGEFNLKNNQGWIISGQREVAEEKSGLWANVHAKQERIKHGSGERMRKPGSKGAPTVAALRKSSK